MSHTDLIIELDAAVIKLRVVPVGTLAIDSRRDLVDELTLTVQKERDEAGLCPHFLPYGECKVRRCRLTKSNATMARLSKKYSWFGVRS